MIGKLILGPLPGDGDFRLRRFAQPQGHDPVLSGPDPCVERAGQVIAADVHEVPAFLLATAAQLHLEGDFDEVGGGGRVEDGQRLRRFRVRWQVEQAVGRHDGKSPVAGRRPSQFLADRHQLAVQGLVFALAVLAPDADLKEMQAVGDFAFFVDIYADTAGAGIPVAR